ncbi:YhcN/YlaJ family sporulation lipoprotein [Desmospora activa]|uniref:Sporulation lipoprotein YhcN/YlaJ n=1 Tax=Desmospora activa DSM 45169 TaxID=1121389 RepID=A0A2T4Z703_9BACL|nr:YhcN/YlaJ family sporulation lipoprotein [Desmospora activa]PTM57677.1 sporulation lipoprotein YhcN/YlaJ [Desmospora activa DSM 45169]
MRKRAAFLLFALLWLVTSCTPSARPDDGYDESLNKDGNNEALDFVSDGRRPQGKRFNMIGYSRQSGNELYNATDGGAVPGPDVYIDRTVLARQIAFLTNKLPKVDETAVLVTDDQVLIGVKGKEEKPDENTLYEAKRTALSLTPRYFKINVTGDPEAREQIIRIGSQTGSTRERVKFNQQEMERLIERMDRTPLDLKRGREGEFYSQKGKPMSHKRFTPSAGDLSH